MIPENDQNESGHKFEMFMHVFLESKKFCIAVNKRLFLKAYSCINELIRVKMTFPPKIGYRDNYIVESYSPTGTTLWEHC